MRKQLVSGNASIISQIHAFILRRTIMFRETTDLGHRRGCTPGPSPTAVRDPPMLSHACCASMTRAYGNIPLRMIVVTLLVALA